MRPDPYTTVEQIAKRRGIAVHNVRLDFSGNHVTFDTDGLPILPFFTDLAIALDVPLSNISVEHSQGSDPGCSCGPSPCDFSCEVTLVRDIT